MGPTPVYGARAEKPLQNADFAMKQTNICRLSGDIITITITVQQQQLQLQLQLQQQQQQYLQHKKFNS